MYHATTNINLGKSLTEARTTRQKRIREKRRNGLPGIAKIKNNTPNWLNSNR